MSIPNIESFLESGERIGTAGDTVTGNEIRFMKDEQKPYCGSVFGHEDDGSVKVASIGQIIVLSRNTPVLIKLFNS